MIEKTASKPVLEKTSSKPPLPKYSSFRIRKGVYHATLDFVESLCDTSSGLVDVFPVEDRREALMEVGSMQGCICVVLDRRLEDWLDVLEHQIAALDFLLQGVLGLSTCKPRNLIRCFFLKFYMQSISELNAQLASAENDGGSSYFLFLMSFSPRSWVVTTLMWTRICLRCNCPTF